MNIENNVKEFQKILANKSARLIAVSKTKPVSDIRLAYNAGQRDFGENKVQELRDKSPELPGDIRWHMIGHLQTNKVKYIAEYIHLIHSVDSPKLLTEINKQAAKFGRVVDCLLQVHIAEEETKYGFDEKELLEFINSDEFSGFENIKVAGLMGMATNTDDKDQVRKEFRTLKTLFDKLSKEHKLSNTDWKELSMGMSSDYQVAIDEGSTMVRVGSSIFGARNYH